MCLLRYYPQYKTRGPGKYDDIGCIVLGWRQMTLRCYLGCVLLTTS